MPPHSGSLTGARREFSGHGGDVFGVSSAGRDCGSTETIIGNWLACDPGVRQKSAGHQEWPGHRAACPGWRWRRHDSRRHRGLVRRLAAAVADRRDRPVPDPLARAPRVPAFGMVYTTRPGVRADPIHEQLEAAGARLVRAGKGAPYQPVNETPLRRARVRASVAEQHGLPRIATVQERLLPGEPCAGQQAGQKPCTGPERVAARLFPARASGCSRANYDAEAAPRGRRTQDARCQIRGRCASGTGPSEALVAARQYNELARTMALRQCRWRWLLLRHQ